MELIDTIQKIVKNCLDNMSLTDMVTGTVVSVNPLSVVLVNNMLPLPSNVLIPINIPYFQIGDKLVMLRVLNGQNFLILSRTPIINSGEE